MVVVWGAVERHERNAAGVAVGARGRAWESTHPFIPSEEGSGDDGSALAARGYSETGDPPQAGKRSNSGKRLEEHVDRAAWLQRRRPGRSPYNPGGDAIRRRGFHDWKRALRGEEGMRNTNHTNQTRKARRTGVPECRWPMVVRPRKRSG